MKATKAATSSLRQSRRFASSIGRQLYDVAIVGGGPVGNSMACSLGHSQWLKDKRVVILESAKPQRLGSPPLKYSNRVFACSPASIQMFKDLGIWQTLLNYRVKEVEGLYVLDACSRSKVQFEPHFGANSVSHLIEDEAITKALHGRIVDYCKNVEIRAGVKVDECRLPSSLAETARLKLSDGSEIDALLVIGADGARSGIRRQMNVTSTNWDYGQMAIVCTLSVDSPGKNSIAWQRFTPLGPIALLPLTDQLSSLVWTSATQDAKRLLALPADQFVDELNHYLFTNAAQNSTTNQALGFMDQCARALRFSERPNDLKQPPTVLKLHEDSRAAFPLAFNHAQTYVKTRTALIGDSAHRLHPLAGQGVNLGWSDVRILTASLESACKEGGSLTYLREYDSASQRHNIPIMVTVDWLNRLYRTSSGPLVFLRSIGLHAVDKIVPLKISSSLNSMLWSQIKTMKRVFVLLVLVFISKSQSTTTDEVVTNGNRFGESQSLRQPHSLDDLLQREEWRDELVTLSLSTTAPETDTSKKKSPSEDDQSMDMRELNRLKNEQEKLEKELSELNEFNDAMERKLQLQLLIQQKSSREREVINGFLTYNYLKHGPVPGIRCSGTKTEKNRDQLSCKISNPIEFVKAGLRVHNEFQESLGDLSEHRDFTRNYEAHRKSQESEYAMEMEPFLENLKPYVGLRMDEPVNAIRYPKLKDFDVTAKRNIDKLCSSRSSSTVSRNSTTIFIDLNSRGYPIGDLLNKYLGLTPLDVHPLPWELPFCKPWSIEDEKSKLWAMLKSPHTILKSPGLYMPELDLIPVLSSFMQHPNRRDFLLADFGQRVGSLMKYEIGPRWLLVELAAMFWRASGMFNEALACIAENLYGAEPIHTANIDISLFQLVRMLIRARSVEGTASDVALLMKIAILNLHVSDPSVLCLAALTAPTTEQSLFYLWQAYEIDDEYAPAVIKLEEHYCKRKVTFGRPIQDFYQPICCWQSEHDIYCFKRPDLEGSCFKIETKIVDDKIEHEFKSFRCSGTYVAKSYLPPPIARFAIGFMRPALQIRDQLIEDKINQIFQLENEKKRKIEKQKLEKVLPLDYGGFSYKRMAKYSQLDGLEKLQTRIDEYVDLDYVKKNAERIERAKMENGKPKEKEILRTFDGEIVEFNEDETVSEDLPPLDQAEPLWHEVIRYDNPLPIKLPQPSQKLHQKGLELFNVNEIPDLKRQCSHAKLSALIEPVSTYVSISAKGFNISSVIDLKLPLPANINMNSVPICPESSNAIPLFDHMAAYKYRDQFTWYQPEKGLRDALLSLGNAQDTVDTIGVRLSEAMKRFRKSKDDVELHWAVSAIAALYFRVKGDAINAVMCLRHSLANAPNDMKEIAAISLANVYHQAGFLNSALLSADYALRASNERIVAVHFTLANIYTSLSNYELANQFYYSTIALQSNFQAAKDRITALHFAFAMSSHHHHSNIGIKFIERFNHYTKGVQLPRELIVIGAGNMAGCMVAAFIDKGCFTKEEVILVTKSEESAEIWREAGYLRSCSLNTFIESRNALEPAHRILLLAVKPQIRHELYVKLRMNDYVLKAEIVCSILAGITHETLKKEIEEIFIGPLIRLTPNVPSAVGSGVTLLYGPNEHANEVATHLLRSTGEVISISEKYFNCASAITGSGPAFAFLMIDALADGAVLNGLPRESAIRMAALMLRGASDLVLQTGKHPGQLKDQVCSPNGTTIEGIRALEKNGVRSALIEAVNETTRRANQLSGS